MSARRSIFVLAALATLGAAALAPTGASAHGFGGHIGGGIHVGGHIGGIHVGGHIGGIHVGGVRVGVHGVWPGHPICGWGCNPHPVWPRYGWRERVRVGGVVAGAPSVAVPTTVAAPVAPANCLTKRELPDGSALFRDRCTQEQAESPPAGAAANPQ